MKLSMSHPLGDVGVLHFSDIPISEFGFFGYLTVKVAILKPLKIIYNFAGEALLLPRSGLAKRAPKARKSFASVV